MMTIARTGSVPVDRSRRLRPRHLWLIPGFGLALLANAQAGHRDLGLVPLLVFGIVPHLTVIVRIGQPHARGQLAPRAVPLFNTVHQPVLPVAVLGLAAAGVLPPFWFVGALAWLSHIVVDRGLGDGLRTTDGYLRNEVGREVPLHAAPKAFEAEPLRGGYNRASRRPVRQECSRSCALSPFPRTS